MMKLYFRFALVATILVCACLGYSQPTINLGPFEGTIPSQPGQFGGGSR